LGNEIKLEETEIKEQKIKIRSKRDAMEEGMRERERRDRWREHQSQQQS